MSTANIAGGKTKVEGLNVSSYTRLKPDGTRSSSANGTTIGKLTVNGTVRTLPPGQEINVPGLANITFQKVRSLPTGLDVTGLRIELLNGDGALVELGRAITRIDR